MTDGHLCVQKTDHLQRKMQVFSNYKNTELTAVQCGIFVL